MTAGHKRKVQIFNHDCAIRANQLGRRLMPEVLALVGDMFIQSANTFNRLAPSGTIAFLSGKLAIEYPLLGKTFAQPARVVKPLPITQGGEPNHTNINPNGLPWVRFWLRIGQFNHQASVPVTNMLLDDNMLDCGIAGDLSMQADFDRADMLNVQPIIRRDAIFCVSTCNRRCSGIQST